MQHLNVTIDIQFHFNVTMDNRLHYFVNLFHISVTSEKLEAILRSYAWLPSVTFQHHFYPLLHRIALPPIGHALCSCRCHLYILTFYPLANEVAKGYSNATARPSVTSL